MGRWTLLSHELLWEAGEESISAGAQARLLLLGVCLTVPGTANPPAAQGGHPLGVAWQFGGL